jgi:hypothetical protein
LARRRYWPRSAPSASCWRSSCSSTCRWRPRGGTVPIEALPSFFGVAAHVEPLRQLLLGTRAILYFDGRGDAGLTHALIVIACELAFWALVGFAVTAWYDHRKLYRISPDLFSYVSEAIDETVQRRQTGDRADAT